MHRVPRTLDDGTGPGAPYFSLPVRPDGHTTGGAPTQLTPVGEWHVGARFSPDRRRLVPSLLVEPLVEARGAQARCRGRTGRPGARARRRPGVLRLGSGDQRGLVTGRRPPRLRRLQGAASTPAASTRCPSMRTGPPPARRCRVVTDAGSRAARRDRVGSPRRAGHPTAVSSRSSTTKDLNSARRAGLLERVAVDAAGVPTGPPVGPLGAGARRRLLRGVARLGARLARSPSRRRSTRSPARAIPSTSC